MTNLIGKRSTSLSDISLSLSHSSTIEPHLPFAKYFLTIYGQICI